jgi:lipid-A-disaccharide synthase-like uncharacterized protein
MRKTSEFHSEPFSEEKKPQNSVPNHFWNKKKTTSEFFSDLIYGTENTQKSIPNKFWEQKTLGKR